MVQIKQVLFKNHSLDILIKLRFGWYLAYFSSFVYVTNWLSYDMTNLIVDNQLKLHILIESRKCNVNISLKHSNMSEYASNFM